MNSLGHERFGQRFAGDILKCIFFKGNVYILIQISLEFVPKCSWQYIIISSGNGSAPNRRQVITWTMMSNFIDTRQQWVDPTLPVRNPLRWRHNDHDSASYHQPHDCLLNHFQRPVARSFNFSLICAWRNDWINNQDAGDLRRHRAHYNVTVMNWMIIAHNGW